MEVAFTFSGCTKFLFKHIFEICLQTKSRQFFLFGCSLEGVPQAQYYENNTICAWPEINRPFFSFYPQVNSFFLLTKFFFFFRSSDLLQKFTVDTSMSHNTKSVIMFFKYSKTFGTKNFKIFSKKFTSF